MWKDGFMDFALRAAHNEEVFRSVNVRIEEGAQMHEIQTPLPFHCECADAHCLSKIEIPPREYESVYKNPDRFFVVPGHERPAVERVIEKREHYLVVEKTGEAAAEVEREEREGGCPARRGISGAVR